MDLNQLKEKAGSLGFSEEVRVKMDEILDGAIAAGSLSEEAKSSLLALIDLEIERSGVEADALEEMALALNDFASATENALESASRVIDEVTDELSEEAEIITSENGTAPQE